jgi:prefoldin subunit 5
MNDAERSVLQSTDALLRRKEELERAKEEAEARADRLARRLRELGVDPDDGG